MVTVVLTGLETADANSSGSDGLSLAVKVLYLAGFGIAMAGRPRIRRASAWALLSVVAFAIGYLSELVFSDLGDAYGDQRVVLAAVIAVPWLVLLGVQLLVQRVQHRSTSGIRPEG